MGWKLQLSIKDIICVYTLQDGLDHGLQNQSGETDYR